MIDEPSRRQKTATAAGPRYSLELATGVELAGVLQAGGGLGCEVSRARARCSLSTTETKRCWRTVVQLRSSLRRRPSPDQARLRRDQVGAGLSAGDGERGQLAEGHEAVLAVGGQRVLAGDRDALTARRPRRSARRRSTHSRRGDRRRPSRRCAESSSRAGTPVPSTRAYRRVRLGRQPARRRGIRQGRLGRGARRWWPCHRPRS